METIVTDAGPTLSSRIGILDWFFIDETHSTGGW